MAAPDVKALTGWRNRRDVREVVRHETKAELPDEVKALLIRMNCDLVSQREQIEGLRQVLELLAIAASKGADQ